MKEELIDRIRAGDQTAFRQLVDGNKDRVLGVCYGYLRNRQDAEDVAQDVFVEVYRSLDNFRGESSLSTWLYRIATTKSMDLIKSRNRKKRQAFFQSATLDEVTARKHTDFSDPAKEMEAEERREVMQNALEQLPDNQRVAFTLSQYEGRSSKEIGEVLELKPNAIDALMFRARKNLRKLLQTYYEKHFLE